MTDDLAGTPVADAIVEVDGFVIERGLNIVAVEGREAGENENWSGEQSSMTVSLRDEGRASSSVPF